MREVTEDARPLSIEIVSNDFSIIERHESAVRIYSRSVPVVFSRAVGSEIFDENGNRYIDFLSAAGSLNYGHNEPSIASALTRYIQKDGILQTLDFATSAKAAFLSDFQRIVLQPRRLEFKVQFTGPTGANAVEAAIKLARKYTGRSSIVAFTNAYHGVSLGALALTGSRSKRAAAGVSLDNVLRLPYDGYLGESFDTLNFAARLFADASSGVDLPAAIIVETVQGEGGLNVASTSWLRALRELARDLGALFIIDDIQAGCGRTGTFFSFEPYDVVPDIVCLSKSISGSGLPMALTLISPVYDVWSPGEHTGTFRGNNLAFVGASAALCFWENPRFQEAIAASSALMRDFLTKLCATTLNGRAVPVGKGMFVGLRFATPGSAERVRCEALALGILAELSGPNDEVLKLMPPLNIPINVLIEGLDKLAMATEHARVS